ncbi:hypothetical protein [Rhizobium leguminosarum]|uniref:hypothetical protein n=1 Tax=Rhizobium leguminosarum TaxID=384 RepID=UPI003F9CA0A4
MPSVEQTIKANLNQEKRDIRDWVADSFNKEILYDEPLSETIEPFVRDGKSEKKLVPDALGSIASWHMRMAMDKSLNEALYPADEIARSGIYRFWHYECAHAVMESDDPAGYKFPMRPFTDVSTMLALGWLSHANRLAETIFDRWDAQTDGNGAVAWKSLPQYLPWLSVKLYKAWRGSDETYDLEPDDGEMADFSPLLEALFDPRPRIFGEALAKAADFHASGCGTDDYDIVNEEELWFFPVELLAACRLRQQRGLDLPPLDYPLFNATPLCRFQNALPVPFDETLAKLLPAYAAATNKFDLKV